MKLEIKKGTTSKRLAIFVQDSSQTDGRGLAGLLFNSAGLAWYYWREDAGNVAGTSVTLATATRGTFASGGFIEKDATNMPGFYEIGVPDAALATGADWVVMVLRGATNMAAVTIEVQLIDNAAKDVFDRLGAPAGASVSADIAAIEAQTDDIGAAGAGLTAVPWNAAWDAEVQSEVEDALVVHRLDELLNADSDIDGAAPPTVGSVFHELLTKTAGSFTYDQTTDSLEAVRDNMGTAQTGDSFARLGAPAGASVSADIAAVKVDTAAILVDTGTTLDGRIPAALVGGRMDASVGAMAAGVVTATAVATGAIDADAIAQDAVTEIRSIVSGTADSGSTTTMVDAARTEADTDYWKDMAILFTSGTISGQARLITAFDPATDTITFSPATTQAVATNTYEILPNVAAAGASAPTAAEVADAVWDEDATAHQTLGTFGQAIGDPVGDTNTIYKAVVTDAVGATIGVDIVDVEGKVDDIGAAGAGLTAIPWNAAWDAEVESEVNDALVAQRLDELLNADSDIDGLAPPTVGSVFHELMSKTAGSFTFDQTTDSNEAIRDNQGTAQTGDSFARLGAPAGASVSADIAAVKVDTAAILVDTGTTLQAELDGIQADTEDIQTRLPAALVGGKMDSALANVAHGGVAATLTLERVIVASTNVNEPGVKVTGNGTGAGILSTGGSSAASGVKAVGGAGGGVGLQATGTTSAAGILAQGGSTGGHGITAQSLGGGSGIVAIGSSTTGTAGIEGRGGAGGDGHGMKLARGSLGGGDDLHLTNEDFPLIGVPVGASVSADIATLQTDTDDIQTRLPAVLVSGRMDSSVGAIAAGVDLSATMKTSVNTEVLDVLNVDTFAEPGQETPPATTTLVKKIGYLYKFLRNKMTQTSTTISVFADDGTTVDQKSTHSDDGTTYTRGEFGTGP